MKTKIIALIVSLIICLVMLLNLAAITRPQTNQVQTGDHLTATYGAEQLQQQFYAQTATARP